jgi:hypothetical protein
MRARFPTMLLVCWGITALANMPAATINVIPEGGTSCILNFDDSIGQSCSANNGALGYSGYGYAQADLLSGLHADSESVFAGTVSGGFGGQAGADADIVDTATLQGAPASGSLALLFAVDGTLGLTTNTGNANDHADEFMSVEVNGTTGNSSVFFLGPNSGSQTVDASEMVSVPYFGISLSLDIALNTTADCANGGADPDSSCDASADFLDTSGILGVEIFDSNGDLVPNATLTSSTGFVYPAVSPAPEPSNLILFSPGLLGVLLLKLRFTRN